MDVNKNKEEKMLHGPVQDKEGESVPCCLSQRWILAYLCFFGVIFVYALRINLSMALVCMVRTDNTSRVDISNVTHGDCVPSAESLNSINKVSTIRFYGFNLLI